jgi:hypothetical protein
VRGPARGLLSDLLNRIRQLAVEHFPRLAEKVGGSLRKLKRNLMDDGPYLEFSEGTIKPAVQQDSQLIITTAPPSLIGFLFKDSPC